MILLGTGETLALGSWNARPEWNQRRSETWTLLGCLVFFLLVTLQMSLSSTQLPALARLAFFAAAGFVLAPLGVWRLLAVPSLAVGLWYLVSIEGGILGCGFCVAMCGAFVTLVFDAPRDRAGADRRAKFATAAAFGWCVCGLFALHTASAFAGFRRLTQSTGTTLANLGLGSSWVEPAVEDPGRAVAFVADGEEAVRPEAIDPSNPRLRQLLPFIDAEAPELQPLRALLVRRLVARHCDSSRAEREVRPEHLVVQRGDGSQDRVAWFQCERPGEEPKVVDLRPLARAPDERRVGAERPGLP
jgi:hypothetical protein